VLAVGDVSFQKRCLGKMRDVSASGRTVLFVSHNMASIESLCNRCLHISEGRIQGLGVPHELIRRYLSAETVPQAATKKLDRHQGRPGRFEPMMRCVRLFDEADTPTATIRMGGGLSVSVEYYSERLAVSPSLGLVIKSNYGQPIFGISNRLVRGYQFEAPSHAGTIACHFQNLPLMPDTYSIDLFFGDLYQDYDVVYDAITFDVTAADVFGNGKLPSADSGSIFWPASWTHIPSFMPLATASHAR
jgi:lipopolysaccharide transport system ATP-binding protein